jgi:PAS domain S-box-containing protein
VILNQRFEVTYINDAALALSGYEPDEVLGHSYGEFWPGFELDAERAARQLEELGSIRFRRDDRRKDGSFIAIEHNVIALGDGSYLGVAHDLTAAVEAENELRQSEERFRRTLERGPDAAVIFNADLRIEYANDAVLELLGTTRAELIGWTVDDDWLNTADRERLPVELQELQRTGSRQVIREVSRPDRSLITAEHNLTPLGDGRYLDVIHNLTPQLEAKAELRESEQQFRTVVATVPNAIVIIDDQQRLILVNEALTAMLGYTKEELLAFEHGTLLVHPDDRQRLVRAANAVRDGAGRSEFSARLLRKDGTTIEVEGLLSDFRLVDCRKGLFAQARDVTARLAAQRDAQVALRALGASEARLARAQAIAAIGCWELDLATGSMWWSDELFRLFGLRPGSVTPDRERLLEAVHPDDRERIDDWLRQAVSATAETFMHGRVMSGPVGELRARWHTEVSRDRAGEPLQVLGTV